MKLNIYKPDCKYINGKNMPTKEKGTSNALGSGERYCLIILKVLWRIVEAFDCHTANSLSTKNNLKRYNILQKNH
jgi:hypothetical protein